MRYPGSPTGHYIVRFDSLPRPVTDFSWQATIVNVTKTGDEPTGHIIWVKPRPPDELEILTLRLYVLSRLSSDIVGRTGDSSFDLAVLD
jgi:hypothetical protein